MYRRLVRCLNERSCSGCVMRLAEVVSIGHPDVASMVCRALVKSGLLTFDARSQTFSVLSVESDKASPVYMDSLFFRLLFDKSAQLRRCEECGKFLVQKQGRKRRFCCDEHRLAWHNRERRSRVPRSE